MSLAEAMGCKWAHAVVVVGLVLFGLPLSPGTARAQWNFIDVTVAAGFTYEHGFVNGPFSSPRHHMTGGVAAGDYDNDGWIDLYVVRGDIGPNLLFRNLGDGTFAEVGAVAGVAAQGSPGETSSGPVFADLDGDGWRDLFVGGLRGQVPLLFRNNTDGTFTDMNGVSGITTTRTTFSAGLGDYDLDGDLDVYLTHWGESVAVGHSSESLWRNDGDFSFTDVSLTAAAFPRLDFCCGSAGLDYSFSPSFADIDNDGWPDLLVAGDFGFSTILLNQRDGTFADITDSSVITDENGMGSAIGDYDNDGNLDWFVSSIRDLDGVSEGNWGVSGNRLYRGLGDGTFEDVTTIAGVRDGYWGWGSTFADYNNDGHLDLFQVNGWGDPSKPQTVGFYDDPSRLFVANGDGTFTESSAARGIIETDLGRGVVSFDYDRDGDVDIFVANANVAPRLHRNDGGNLNHYLAVKLVGRAPNTESIGARVTVSVGGVSQMRELRAGSGFESQDPAIAHFGLGSATSIDSLQVRWPSGRTTELSAVAGDQELVVVENSGSACGDGVVDPGEACDDGNATWVIGEGCDVNCLAAILCGDPNNDSKFTGSDALFTLQTAVGSQTCALSVCDVNTTGGVTAVDALFILQVAVGQPGDLVCA